MFGNKRTTAYRRDPASWEPVASVDALEVGDVALFECLGNSRLFTVARLRHARADGGPVFELMGTSVRSGVFDVLEPAYVVFVPSDDWHFMGGFRSTRKTR